MGRVVNEVQKPMVLANEGLTISAYCFKSDFNGDVFKFFTLQSVSVRLS